MKEPVVCADGHTYEQEAIEEWLRHHSTSPVTNAELPTKQTFPNYSLRSAIQDFVARADTLNNTVEHNTELEQRAMGQVQKASLAAILGATSSGAEERPATPTTVQGMMQHESAVREAFVLFDTNKDGVSICFASAGSRHCQSPGSCLQVLDFSEFKAMMQSKQDGGDGAVSFSDDDVHEVMAVVDLDENGTVDVEEFMSWLFSKGQWQRKGQGQGK